MKTGSLGGTGALEPLSTTISIVRRLRVGEWLQMGFSLSTLRCFTPDDRPDVGVNVFVKKTRLSLNTTGWHSTNVEFRLFVSVSLLYDRCGTKIIYMMVNGLISRIDVGVNVILKKTWLSQKNHTVNFNSCHICVRISYFLVWHLKLHKIPTNVIYLMVNTLYYLNQENVWPIFAPLQHLFNVIIHRINRLETIMQCWWYFSIWKKKSSLYERFESVTLAHLEFPARRGTRVTNSNWLQLVPHSRDRF